MPKLLKAKKLKAPGRVYVSVLLDETRDYQVWLDKFYTRLALEVRGMPDRFEDVTRTNDGEAGELVTGPGSLGGASPIACVVGVLTDVYLEKNTDRRNQPASGELARFFDEAFAPVGAIRDEEIALDFYLAPLDDINWAWKVRGIPLADARLTRLREDRFKLPSESEAEAKQQINAAARRIVVDAEDEGTDAP